MAQETIGWGWAYVQHLVFMFYWAWIPGILAAALLSARYRPRLQEIALKRQSEAAGFCAAIGWGMASGVGRRASVATAERLWGQGVPNHVVLAYLVASHHLGLYLLLLFTLLIGFEFGLGLFIAGLAMLSLLRLLTPILGPIGPGQGDSEVHRSSYLEARVLLPSWGTLLGSLKGWREILREAVRPLRRLGASLLGGLILGALVLAIDNHGYWFFPKWMGDEGVGPALVSTFFAPLLSVVLFLTPGGNLFVASSIWKTWTLAYPGVLSFVLISLLNPFTLRTLLSQHRGWRLVFAIYFTAALSGLIVTGLFTLVGLEVTHVPWFRDLIDRIIMAFPFTMLGAPGGVKGM